MATKRAGRLREIIAIHRLRGLTVLALTAFHLPTQATTVSIKVTDGSTGEPVEFAAIALSNGNASIGGLTDISGAYTTDTKPGTWKVNISALGYNPTHSSITVNENATVCSITLTPAYTQIGEVVVTAKESRGIASASLIDRAAMEHLQPSSFTDLIELLPGAISKDPEMGKGNFANLREARNIQTDGYDTSSLGTSFVVDGVPINTNAEMQATADSDRSNRLSTGKGVDMRSISTDDIESVEIVRGIASAEYGEVTSGLVNIKRKQGAGGLQARFKADMQSQLLYVGKGFNMPGNDWTMNVSVDWLDSRIDPRNNRDNFKRATASARSSKKWLTTDYTTTWNSSLTYVGTFERDKNDPDLTVNNTIDYYTSDKHGISFDNTVAFVSKQQRFFQSLTLTTGLNYTSESLHQEKTIASSRVYPMPISTTEGSNYVGYLPMRYEATLDVDGKPMTAVVKLASRFRYSAYRASNTIKAGVEWDFSKNYGQGQIYDLMRPITAGNNKRPRPFNEVPAMHQLSTYVEHNSDIHLGNHALELQLGLRETQLLHLDKRYYLHNRPYLDPRVNLRWTLPQLFVAEHPIGWEIAGGIGWHTKMPVAAYLYPEKLYTDYSQLNYYHNNEAYRTMNVYTFVEDITNYDLRAARNLKWELRGDITYRGNRLSVTYFRENMNDAFRQAAEVHFYEYRQYDASQYNPELTGSAPTIELLPWTTEKRIATVNYTTNRSSVKKEGVEFTYSSCRIPVIRTRLTINGAWFRTTLSNSEGLWYKPAAIVNGVELQYAGYYNDRDGSEYQSFNTNFTFDTDVPRLGLNFSIAIQNMWFTSTRQLYRDGVPTYYVGTDGEVLPYTADMANDPYLGRLIRTYTSTAFDERRVPVATTFNLKATKKLWHDRVNIAIYVNRLVSITPDYYLYGSLQRRYTSPYFGMELNFKL
jgi:hypothetical protein